MGYSIFSGSNTQSWLKFLITYEKVREESECSAHTFPWRHEWLTRFQNLLLSSLKFTVHIAVGIVASEACACWYVGCDSQKEAEKQRMQDTCSRVCMWTLYCIYVYTTCRDLKADSFLFVRDVCLGTSILWAGLQSQVMSLGSLVLLHKHKSLKVCGDFIPDEMRCHLLCKGKITIVENMTASSAAPPACSSTLDQSFKQNL